MKFVLELKNNSSEDQEQYLVYMIDNGQTHYVCEMCEGIGGDAQKINDLGLTLRARLHRSRGKYAMLEGTVFNPLRLIGCICHLENYQTEDFVGGIYKSGYTKLTIIADHCVNIYLIFQRPYLNTLLNKLEQLR